MLEAGPGEGASNEECNATEPERGFPATDLPRTGATDNDVPTVDESRRMEERDEAEDDRRYSRIGSEFHAPIVL
jgi:hypothetical protein